MNVVYDGPFDEVEIAITGQLACKGDPVDVPDELGVLLLQQDCWSEASD